MKCNLFDSSIAAVPERALEFVSNLLEASTEYSIIANNTGGTIVMWNEGARRLYGYEFEEVVGKAEASILLAPEDVVSGKPQELLDAVRRNGKWAGSTRCRRKNGEQFSCRLVITPLIDNDRKTTGFLFISREISEEMRLTGQLESAINELREQIAHRQKSEAALLEANETLKVRANELEQHTSKRALLADMAEFLQSCASLDEAREVAEQSLPKLFPETGGIVYLNREFGGSIETFAKWNGDDLNSKETFEPLECWALRLGRPHVMSAGKGATKCSHVRHASQAWSMCVPMMAQGQTLGMFHLVRPRSDAMGNPSWREYHEVLAKAVADSVSLAIANVKLRESLREQTIRDPLTRLYNRRYLEDSLNREMSRARRIGASIGVVMLDIDDFKQFNDSFGHLAGDELLRELGTYLKTHVRPEDIPVRYGGEEFTLILPGASGEIVLARAETLRKGFHGIQLDRGIGVDKATKRISVSCGVAVFPEHGTSVEGLLQAADDALYNAKKSGKDCVMVFASQTQATTRAEPRVV